MNELGTVIIGMLATWRITSLLISEDGPFNFLSKLRDGVGVRFDEQSRTYGTNEVAKALTCMWCASVYVGLGVSAIQGNTMYDGFLLGLTYSAGAILINRWVSQ